MRDGMFVTDEQTVESMEDLEKMCIRDRHKIALLKIKQEVKIMPTFNQLVRKGRQTSVKTVSYTHLLKERI